MMQINNYAQPAVNIFTFDVTNFDLFILKMQTNLFIPFSPITSL